MKNIRSMRGMNVVCGVKPLGRCVMAQLSRDMKRLDGVWYATRLGGMRLIDAEDICVVGARAIIAEKPGQRVRFKPISLFTRAVSTDGERLGAVVDAHIDEVSLIVISLTISTGFFDDMIAGKRISKSFARDAENGRVVISDII